MRFSRNSIVLFVLLLLAALRSSFGGHALLLQFNLEEMTAVAGRIFTGRCIDVSEGAEYLGAAWLPITTYTFSVSEVLKGWVPRTIALPQLGHP
jgi:hypothetical protein